MLNLQGLVAASAVGQTGGDGSIVVALAILLVVVIVALVRKKRRLKALSQAADTTETAAPETQPAAQQSAPARTATVPAGDDELELDGISERDAAIVMAITANAIGKPPAQLRFHSIKEVKEK